MSNSHNPIDNLIALIDGVIAETEPGWQAVVFTSESRDSVPTYAGDYTFNTEASTLSVVAQPLTEGNPPSLPYVPSTETRLIAPGFDDL